MSLRLKWQCTPRRSRFLIATTLTTIIGGLVTSAVIAAVSFQGQGTIKFDRVSTKKLTVSQEAQFLDSVKNPTPGKPVKISDSLKVTGTADFFGVLKNTTAGKPVKVDDGLQVTGALSVGSFPGLSALVSSAGFATTTALGSTDDNVDLLLHNTTVLYNYLDCVSEYAQYTTYLESADTIYCWNTWIAGVGKMAAPGDATAQDATGSTERYPTKSPR